jgi:hypothetical protein
MAVSSLLSPKGDFKKMNEPLFKNSFVRDEQTIKTLFISHYLKSKLIKVVGAIYFVLLINAFISLAIYQYSDALGFLIVYGLIFCSIVFARYKQDVKLFLRRDKELAGERESRVIETVFEDKIEHEFCGNTQILDYSNVAYVVNLQEYVHIVTKAKYVYIFKKDSFTLGNAEDFIEFLKSKGIKVQK